MDIGQGTNFEVKIPWSVSEQGFQTKLSGTLMMIEAKTSLPFRDLLRCETLQINVDMNYPMKWNEHQEWVKKIKFLFYYFFVRLTHSLIREVLIQSCSTGAQKNFTNYVFSILSSTIQWSYPKY